MNTKQDEPRSTEDGLAWIFLAEFSLAEVRLEVFMEPGDGSLVQALRELGVQPGSLLEIQKALVGFLEEMMGRYGDGGSKVPALLRLYCQKQTMEDASGGGWGYFLVERGLDFQACSGVSSQYWVDLYLYREGE